MKLLKKCLSNQIYGTYLKVTVPNWIDSVFNNFSLEVLGAN